MGKLLTFLATLLYNRLAVSQKIKQLFSISRHESRLLDYLLLPSWLSGLITVTVSLFVVLGANILSQHTDGTLRQLFTVQSSTTSVNTDYDTIGNNLSANSLISNIPLLIFWAATGLIVYSFVINLLTAFSKVAHLKAEMNYMHADRKQLQREAVEHLIVRLIVLAVWFPLLHFSTHVVLPYAIAVGHVAIGIVGLLPAIGYTLWGISLLVICLHLHTIMLRLLLLRPRLFWQSAYD